MPQFFPLCLQIPLVVFIDRGNDRNLINDTQSAGTSHLALSSFLELARTPETRALSHKLRVVLELDD